MAGRCDKKCPDKWIDNGLLVLEIDHYVCPVIDNNGMRLRQAGSVGSPFDN